MSNVTYSSMLKLYISHWSLLLAHNYIDIIKFIITPDYPVWYNNALKHLVKIMSFLMKCERKCTLTVLTRQMLFIYTYFQLGLKINKL